MEKRNKNRTEIINPVITLENYCKSIGTTRENDPVECVCNSPEKCSGTCGPWGDK